jgi:CBS domain containing-hemolysin-like protein
MTVTAVVALMIFFNALYVAGEFATVSARRTRIIRMAGEGNRLARLLLPILDDAHRLDNTIAASQVGITLSSLVLGIYGQQQITMLIAPLFERLLGNGGSGSQAAAAGTAAVVVLIVLTGLQVVLGELLPKSLSLMYPEEVALATVLPMKWSAEIILRPLIVLLNGSGVLLLRLLGAEATSEHSHVHSPEEIQLLVKESRQSGLIDAGEQRLVQNVFRVGRTLAGDIALPRNRMIAAEVNDPVEDVLRAAASSSYTRIPIYERDIDHIAGFVHLRDLFNLYRENPRDSLRRILRQVPFVPETLSSLEVWSRLTEAGSYLAIVFDEYGGTLGMITLEDLVEELFGELQDEFDRENALISRMGAGRLVVRGDMLIANLNEMLGLSLPHDVSHTLGGLVQEVLGRVPRPGDEVAVGAVRLRVETVANMAPQEVCLMLPKEAAADLDEEGYL